MKTIISIIVWFAILYFAYAFGRYGEKASRPEPTVTEQIKAIQKRVGCVHPSPRIGPETKRLVNAAIEREKAEAEEVEKQKFNKYAKKYMTNTGSPKSE